ncbi:MAG TPA: LamG-like jellyroll fold domain-containing protein [Candidatus Bathyarchaeia archaeon]|nr:LamG-like jellyroll fold domain-containing protein [Candidatus Bathyarchaeia archaeon]
MSGNLTNTDPKFVNVANKDFHLQSASPAIGAALASDAPGSDFDGLTRPQGTGYDAGAFEYAETNASPKYKCSSGSCVRDDANGTFTSSNCDNACSVPPPAQQNPVANFKLDETSGQTLNDSAGTNTGYLGATADAEAFDPQRAAGKSNNGLQFDGTDDKATINPSPSVNNLTQFTYSAWIKPTGWGGGGYGRVVSKESSGKQNEISFDLNQPQGNTISVGVFSTAENQLFASVASQNAIVLNAWQYVTATYDDAGDRKLHIYVNGREVAYQRQDTVAGTLLTTVSPIILGNNWEGSRGFPGIIDEVKVWNRALSASDVLNDYNTYASLLGDLNSDNLVNLSDFDILKADFLKTGSFFNLKSDIDGDGIVTIKDAGMLMSGWK